MCDFQNYIKCVERIWIVSRRCDYAIKITCLKMHRKKNGRDKEH